MKNSSELLASPSIISGSLEDNGRLALSKWTTGKTVTGLSDFSFQDSAIPSSVADWYSGIIGGSPSSDSYWWKEKPPLTSSPRYYPEGAMQVVKPGYSPSYDGSALLELMEEKLRQRFPSSSSTTAPRAKTPTETGSLTISSSPSGGGYGSLTASKGNWPTDSTNSLHGATRAATPFSTRQCSTHDWVTKKGQTFCWRCFMCQHGNYSDERCFCDG